MPQLEQIANIRKDSSSDIQVETQNPLMCRVHKNIELTTVAVSTIIELQCYKCTQESIRDHMHNSTRYFDVKEVD